MTFLDAARRAYERSKRPSAGRLGDDKSVRNDQSPPPWSQAEADALVADALGRFDAPGWPADAEARRELGRRMDAIDDAYLGRDLDALRKAVAVFLN
jgi:hypothetical protein